MKSIHLLIFIAAALFATGCNFIARQKAVSGTGSRQFQVAGGGDILYARIKGTVRWEAAAYAVAEGGGRVTLTAILDTRLHRGVAVPLTFAGDATSPADYEASATWLQFDPGQKQASIELVISDDAVFERDKTILVGLGEGRRIGLTSPDVAVVTIQNDDAPPVAQWEMPSQSVAENASWATATVRLSAASSEPVSVPYTVAGTATSNADFILVNGILTVPAGATQASISIPLIDDAVDEVDETIVLSLGEPIGELLSATLGEAQVHAITLVDDDLAPPPTLAWTTAETQVAEGSGAVRLTAALSAATLTAVTVPYTVTGSAERPADHSLADGTLTFPAGSTAAFLDFALTDDRFDELDETVVVRLGSPTGAVLGATVTATVTIADDDDSPVLAFAAASQTVDESAGSATIKVSLSSASGLDVTVPYLISGTATPGMDYAGLPPAGSLTFPAGSTTATLTFALINDADVDDDETILVLLGQPMGATLGATDVHTLTIADDDVTPDPTPSPTPSPSPDPNLPRFSFATSQVAGNEGGSAFIFISLSAASPTPVTAILDFSGSTAITADYSLVYVDGNVLTMPAGSTFAYFAVNFTEDALVEGPEWLVITMTSPTGAVLGTPSQMTIDIADND
jgi:hypothetical protein